MTDDEAKELIKFISASWSNYSVTYGSESIRAFRIFFDGYPMEALIIAIAYIADTEGSQYPPSWAKIRKALKELNTDVTASNAWDEMVKIANRLGYDRGRHRIERKKWAKVGLRFFKELCYSDEKYIGILRDRFEAAFALDEKEEVRKHLQRVVGNMDRLKALELNSHKRLLDLHTKGIGKDDKKEK